MIKKSRMLALFLAFVMALSMMLTGCGGTSTDETASGDQTSDVNGGSSASGEAVEIPGLVYESQLELEYATCYDVYFYEDGYSLIDVHDHRQYLLVPEDGSVPEDIDPEIVILQMPLDNIYLAATSAMSLFDAADAMDSISFTSLEADDWSVQAAADRMNAGDMVYAGKYNIPDYEILVNDGCDVAIESTMIFHSPNVMEMIEDLGIPVFVDRSSYETEPLGRTEWIKLYGVMTGHLEDAEAFFSEQSGIMDQGLNTVEGEPTVVFFYINTSNQAVIRSDTDYITTMITQAGGVYPFDVSADQSGKANISISFEEFYAVASEADYLIYNTSIDSSVDSMADLLAKDSHMADFAAVQNGNVWMTENSLYQATDRVIQFVLDVNNMITDGDPEEMLFLSPLN